MYSLINKILTGLVLVELHPQLNNEHYHMQLNSIILNDTTTLVPESSATKLIVVFKYITSLTNSLQ